MNDPRWQVAALIDLIKVHDESVVPEIIDLLASSDEDVRAETACAPGILETSIGSRLDWPYG